MNKTSLTSPVRVAILGYGFAGKSFHAYLVGLVPELKIIGIMSRNPETRKRIETEQAVFAFADPEAVFADPNVDLVVVATPNSTHAELCIAALNAGKHVVTDKVMCTTLTECDQMLEAARRSERLLTVFQNRRFDGDFLTVRDTIESGRLGTVRWIEMAWQGFGAWGGWRGQAEMGGGRFLDLGAHLVDQMLLLFPDAPKSVYCRMHHDFPDSDVESEALMVITFAGGQTGVIDLSGMTTISKPRFLIKGDAGTLSKYGLDPQEDAMKAGNIDAAVESPDNYAFLKTPQSQEHVPTRAGRWRTYYENIADALLNGAEPHVKPDEMRRAIAVLDGARQSAQMGEVVRF